MFVIIAKQGINAQAVLTMINVLQEHIQQLKQVLVQHVLQDINAREEQTGNIAQQVLIKHQQDRLFVIIAEQGIIVREVRQELNVLRVNIQLQQMHKMQMHVLIAEQGIIVPEAQTEPHVLQINIQQQLMPHHLLHAVIVHQVHHLVPVHQNVIV